MFIQHDTHCSVECLPKLTAPIGYHNSYQHCHLLPNTIGTHSWKVFKTSVRHRIRVHHTYPTPYGSNRTDPYERTQGHSPELQCFVSASLHNNIPHAHLDIERQTGHTIHHHADIWQPKTSMNAQRAPSMSSCNDPSAGSPTETLLRLLLPLNAQVWSSSHVPKQHLRAISAAIRGPC